MTDAARWKPRGYLFFEEAYASVFAPTKDRSLKNGEVVAAVPSIEVRRSEITPDGAAPDGATQSANEETPPREKPVASPKGLAARYVRS